MRHTPVVQVGPLLFIVERARPNAAASCERYLVVGPRPRCALSSLETEADRMPNGSPRLLVADHQFILATRDTGYRSLANAVAELVDNSIQAGASDVRLFVREGAGKN